MGKVTRIGSNFGRRLFFSVRTQVEFYNTLSTRRKPDSKVLFDAVRKCVGWILFAQPSVLSGKMILFFQFDFI